MDPSPPRGSPEPHRTSSRGGPGWLVAAAFIGPGTVTTATVAGANFGAVLLWALLFSTVATVVLQEMSARLGVKTGQGLGEAIRARFAHPLLRMASAVLILSAVTFGNAAYQTGNLLGGGMGLEGLMGGEVRWWALLLGALAAVLLWTGSYRLLEGVLKGLVAMMAVVFLVTAFRVAPQVPGLLSGLLRPSLPPGTLLLTMGLVGTTVVPYNLFLHASAVAEKWGTGADARDVRRDLLLSIPLGGAVSMAILITAAGTIHQVGGGVDSAADMARQLEPVLGVWARAFFAAGLFAAGLTSSITAPLAAAWASAGVLGWERDLRSPRLRLVWGGVLVVGTVLATLGIRPVPAILFAQAANGLLLPAVAVFLLLAVNDRRRMGDAANGAISNVLGVVMVLVALGLGVRSILTALGVL